MAEAERLRQSLLADAGRGDLLKTIIERVELRPNGLRMILSLVPLTPAAAPPNRLQGCVFTREFPLRIKCGGVEMRFAIDASDPRACRWPEQGATNPDPVRGSPGRRRPSARSRAAHPRSRECTARRVGLGSRKEGAVNRPGLDSLACCLLK